MEKTTTCMYMYVWYTIKADDKVQGRRLVINIGGAKIWVTNIGGAKKF